ncbi:TlpA family protein disulfide reductase [Ornithobacterium rhinotracheale]|uniref:TlpA family protein disulfide reductase n=1 Tax=Ornithobacterium rhinotracheale TaxID=28251 RepID=UPI00129C4901|nr:TlpA disulfide reductase family protein [Ornithobacterium rhinotracheale]MRJ11660.1 TlpA family protein disulfide reductase [Ornithobacterium rhinotracheale]
MKKTYLLHILCVLLLSLNTTETLAQTKTEDSTTVSTAKETIVKGIIPELKNQTISIDYIDFLNGEKSDFVEVDKNGKFSKTLNFYSAFEVMIRAKGKAYLFMLKSGDLLDLANLTKNQQKYDELYFKRVMNQMAENPYPNYAYDLGKDGIDISSPAYIKDYEKRLEEVKAKNTSVLQNLLNTETLPKDLEKTFNTLNERVFYSYLLKLKSHAVMVTSADFDSVFTAKDIAFLNNMEVLPDNYVMHNLNKPAFEALNVIVISETRKNPKFEKEKENKSLNQIYENMYEIISRKIKNPKLIQAYFAQDIYNQRTDFQFDSVKPFFDKYITLDYLREPIINKYVAIQKGVLPNINLLEKVKGTKAEKFVQKIFNENKGKYIYLDIWATWCGPCLKLMPMLKQIEKDSKSQDIAFVKLCMQSPENKWKEISKLMNLDNNKPLVHLGKK